MHRRLFAPTLLLGFAVTACTSSPPEARTKSATAADYQIETVVEGLNRPWGVAWLPEGAMLVTEKDGRLRIVRESKLVAEPVSGVPEVYSGGQGGLMDIVLHPKFAENRLVYMTLSLGTGRENRTALVRGKFTGTALEDVKTLWENPRSKQSGQHFGSRLVWLPDGTLLMSVGDGGNPPVSLDGQNIRNQAQSTDTAFGKVLRFTDEGKPAPDNPFRDKPGMGPFVYSLGHRNIQGLARDPEGKRVWANEHVARGGDELNLVEKGKNYGWPLATQSNEYVGGRVSPNDSLPGMVDPLWVWTPSKAPSGLAFYSGTDFPDWKGHLFSGGLMTGDVKHLHLDAAGKVTKEESIPIGQRVRDVRQGPDGRLYVLTDDRDGRLLRIVPARD
jgi:aldose sugar dehydrogenase